MKKKLSPEDIAVLKKLHRRTIFFEIVGWLFILGFAVAHTAWWIREDDFRFLDLLLYMIYIPIIAVMFDGFFRYGREIKQGEKIVLYAECKIVTYEINHKPQEYLAIEGYGGVTLFRYNKKNYRSLFTELPERFEIHLSPKSEVILFAKKIPPVVYPPAQPVKAKRS